MSWVFQGAFYLCALNTSPGRRLGGILTRCLDRLIWLHSPWRSSDSILSSILDGRASHPSIRESPAPYRGSSFWPLVPIILFFQLPKACDHRTMASDLKVLIFIPAASHSAVTRSSESWRSWTDGTNRSWHGPVSSKEQRPDPDVTKKTPSTPWLRLEILSIKVINRIGDKGQPWRVQPSLETSPTYCQERRPGSDSAHTGRNSPHKAPLAGGEPKRRGYHVASK